MKTLIRVLVLGGVVSCLSPAFGASCSDLSNGTTYWNGAQKGYGLIIFNKYHGASWVSPNAWSGNTCTSVTWSCNDNNGNPQLTVNGQTGSLTGVSPNLTFNNKDGGGPYTQTSTQITCPSSDKKSKS